MTGIRHQIGAEGCPLWEDRVLPWAIGLVAMCCLALWIGMIAWAFWAFAVVRVLGRRLLLLGVRGLGLGGCGPKGPVLRV